MLSSKVTLIKSTAPKVYQLYAILDHLIFFLVIFLEFIISLLANIAQVTGIGQEQKAFLGKTQVKVTFRTT